MVYTIRFFSSKCSLFHNSNIFGSCIIHILYTGCAKIKKIVPAPKGYICDQYVNCVNFQIYLCAGEADGDKLFRNVIG